MGSYPCKVKAMDTRSGVTFYSIRTCIINLKFSRFDKFLFLKQNIPKNYINASRRT